MPQYRKKPVVIEAFDSTPLFETDRDKYPEIIASLPDWLRGSFGTLLFQDGNRIGLNTPNGPCEVNKGDWIVLEDGYLWQYDADLFAATYEAV